MTIIELLVVIGVLMLLLVTVAPVLSPSPEQKGREAAATVISMINRAQTRAVDQKADAGLWLEPLLTSGSVRKTSTTAYIEYDGAPVAMASLDMFACEPQDSYNGDDPDNAKAFVYPVNLWPNYEFVRNFRTDDSLVLFEKGSCAFIRDFCAASSRITISPGSGAKTYQFRLLAADEQASQIVPNHLPKPYRPCNLGPSGPLSASDDNFQDPNDTTSKFYRGYGASLDPADGGPAPELIVGWIRSDDGSAPTTANTPWNPPFDPKNPTFPVSAAGKPFAIERPNTRTATPPLSIPAGYAIDVAWSSYGTTLLHNSYDSGRSGNGSQMQLLPNLFANQPVQIMFDSNGALKHLVVRTFATGLGGGAVIDAKLNLPVDLFLLIGRADRVGRPYVASPTDANPGANWQYPDSRWIKISHGLAKTLIADPYLGVNNVYDSQAYARGDIAALRN